MPLDDGIFLKDLRFHDAQHEATSEHTKNCLIYEMIKITRHKDPRMLMCYYYIKDRDLAPTLKQWITNVSNKKILSKLKV